MNDRDLVQMTLRGDRTAYRRLIERYRNAVYGLAVSFVGDFDVAEDLAQEAFIRGYYRLHALEDGDRFGAWLRTVAANLCRMELRRRRALPLEPGVRDLETIVSPSPSPDEIQERDETRQRVLEALRRLPQGEREAVTLYYLDDQGVKAVAGFLGISSNAVKARLHRARQKLRKEMTTMAKKTLSQKKLGPEFADRIEIRRFSDLARLTDDELRTLAERVGGPRKAPSLAYSLAADDSATEQLKSRILELLPEAERQSLVVNLEFFEKHLDPLDEYRQAVLRDARRLQEEGAIRPAPRRRRRFRAGTVEVERFSDIPRLTDYEIQQLLRHVDTKHVAAALTGKRDFTGPDAQGLEEIKRRLFANMSERVGNLILIKQTHSKPSRQDIANWQGHIVAVVRSLQAAGVIRPGNSPMTCPRVDVRSFQDCGNLTDYEIQATLRETDMKDLAVALKAKGKRIRSVEKRVRVNMSPRVRDLMEKEMERVEPTRREIEACQQRIVGTVKKLQVLGSIRLPSRRPSRRQYEHAVAEMAQDQIERDRHSGRWVPRQARVLVPYLASLACDGGLEGALEGLSDPVYELAIRLLGEGAPRGELIPRLQEAADEETDRIAREYQTAIAGFAAIADGQEPREIGRLLTQA